MSITTLAGARLVATAFDPSPEHPVIEARLRRGAVQAHPYLARLPDADLAVLGFAPGEIARIRATPTAAELIKL